MSALSTLMSLDPAIAASAPSPSLNAAEPNSLAILCSDLVGRLSSSSVVRSLEPMARRTTLRVGGPADLYVEPATEEDLAATLAFCKQRHLRHMILGRGSNLLVRDGGIRGAVICLAGPAFARLEVDGTRLRCGAGVRLKHLAVEARRSGLAGLEFLEGIPGSLGGALRMNAGAMGSATFEVVESLRFMDALGRVGECTAADAHPRYRSCPMLIENIALGAVLRGAPSAEQAIRERMDAFSRRRWDTQPHDPSAGCMFKNPSTVPAGKLVEELGLKGLRRGGALVSTVHANFIVNDGKAKAADVLALIEFVRAHARAERGIELETEVEIIGEDDVAGGGPATEHS